MNKYVYAKLFVKLAKALAAITLVFGIAFTIAFGYIKSQKLLGLNYHPASELEIDKNNLTDTYQKTKNKILDSLYQSTFEPDKKIFLIDLEKERELFSSVPENQKPEAYEQFALRMQERSVLIKNYHKGAFDQSIQILRNALLGYASKIKNELAVPETKNLNSSISSTTLIKGFRVFEDEDSSDAYRRNILSKIRARLLALQQESTKIENIEAAKNAIENINCIENLLDIPKEQNIDIESQKNNTTPQLNSEKIANKLLDDQVEINSYIYDNWKLDAQIDKLLLLAKKEKVKRDDLKTEKRIYLLDSILEFGLIIIVFLAFSFCLMVLADIVSAFINMSNNTDIFQAYASNPVGGADSE